ncbi:MAG TPA: glycosyltransferase family 4 protein [Myxococcota bacterium]|nr:glycosyltransferase family 4 protein [Myxococcota bacterium]
MRIAFLCYRGNMKSGGQGVYLAALTRELAALGCQIDVFVGPPYPDPLPWARVTRLPNQMFWGKRFDKRPGAFLDRARPWSIFRPLDFFEFAVTRFGFLPEPFAFSVRAASALARELRAGARYDLVHDVQSVSYGLLYLQALGLPVVTTIHHPLSIDLRSSLARDRTFAERKGSLTFYPVRSQARTARRLAAVLTSSEASKRAIAADFGVRPKRIHDVRNGVELAAPGARRPRPERHELLFVGRCGDPNKGLEFLLHALALLPHDVGLRVLDDFPRDTPLARTLRELGLESRVRFSGKVSAAELDAAYRTASAVVLPSLFEGFGLPAIEALAAGTPVVASSAGALPELIADAGAGRLVPPRDPPGLAKAIAETLERWDAAHAEALAARPRLEAIFGWRPTAERTLRAYQQVLHDWRGAP